MGLNGRQLQMLHEGLGSGPAALEFEGHHAAGAVGQILFRQGMILVAGEAQ